MYNGAAAESDQAAAAFFKDSYSDRILFLMEKIYQKGCHARWKNLREKQYSRA